MKKLLDIIDRVKSVPAMYIPGETYGEFVALIFGYNVAKKNEPLAAFHEWLVLKNNGGDNLFWSGLALLILNIRLPSFVEGPKELHLKAIEGLCNLIRLFYEEQIKCGKINLT